MRIADYGDATMELALRGLELKTRDPYLSGWPLRVTPALGHLPLRMITNGAVDRTVQNRIADEHGRSTVKNTNAVQIRVMEQAVRDGIIKVNPARVTGWQKLCKQVEDELLDPRALALPDWETLVRLAEALVAASYDRYRGWGDVVTTLGYEHLRRHGLRHTGLTWFADTGVQVHALRKVAGRGSLTTTQRYLHPNVRQITAADAALSARLSVLRTPRSLPVQIASAN